MCRRFQAISLGSRIGWALSCTYNHPFIAAIIHVSIIFLIVVGVYNTAPHTSLGRYLAVGCMFATLLTPLTIFMVKTGLEAGESKKALLVPRHVFDIWSSMLKEADIKADGNTNRTLLELEGFCWHGEQTEAEIRAALAHALEYEKSRR